jgi:hypothetical protein
MESLSDPHCLAAAHQRMHRNEKVSGTVSPWGRGQGARLAKTERGLKLGPNTCPEGGCQGCCNFFSGRQQIPRVVVTACVTSECRQKWGDGVGMLAFCEGIRESRYSGSP